MSQAARSKTATVHAGGPPPTARQLLRELVDLAAAVPWFLGALLLRGRHRRWGATDAELAASMPGDDLVPGCQYSATRAITIAAPPGERLRMLYRWRPGDALLALVLNEFGDFPMMRRMLLTLRRRAEGR